jgi:hypothetical protein
MTANNGIVTIPSHSVDETVKRLCWFSVKWRAGALR